MEIVVRGRHLDLSERFRDHVVGKVGRVERFGMPISHVDVEVSYEPNPRQSDTAYEVEFTCSGKGAVVRAEGHAQDKYAATDVALARLERQLRRAAGRRRDRRTKVTMVPAAEVAPVSQPEVPEAPEDAGDPATVFAAGPIVVRLKEYSAEPMTVAAAVEAMELVGHDFYLFRDSDTGAPSVLYHRRGYSYGLLRLEDGTDG